MNKKFCYALALFDDKIAHLCSASRLASSVALNASFLRGAASLDNSGRGGKLMNFKHIEDDINMLERGQRARIMMNYLQFISDHHTWDFFLSQAK